MSREDGKRGAARAVAQLSIGAVCAVRKLERQLASRADEEGVGGDVRNLRIDLETIARLAAEAVSDSSVCSHCGTVVM